jgi:F420-non-reducing hydrogenase large subunit
MAFRAYDPCFGCASHAAAGKMPMEILVRGLDGSVRETIRRFC